MTELNCFIDYAKVFDCVDHNKLWKILQEIGILDHLTFILRNLCADQEATVGIGTFPMEQQTGSKLGKEYVKAVYCHPAYLTSMQSTSCKMLGWRNHKPESKLLGEISTTSDMHWRRQWHPTPVLLPGKSHGWRSLVGCSPWGLEVGHD